MSDCAACEPCPMGISGNVEIQEIHITVKTDQLREFKVLCESYGGKAITIHVPTLDQPEIQSMSAIPFKGSREAALQTAYKICDILYDMAIEVDRVKLECSVNDPEAVYEKGYFEGHLSIECTEKRLTLLREIASTNLARVSNNPFKEGVYMMTFRSECGKMDFFYTMQALARAVKFNKFKVLKQIKEFCYYDTNISVDKNWV